MLHINIYTNTYTHTFFQYKGFVVYYVCKLWNVIAAYKDGYKVWTKIFSIMWKQRRTICDCRRVLDWWLDLLPIYSHDSWLHFTDHWHTKTSVFGISESPLAVSWRQVLTQELRVWPSHWISHSKYHTQSLLFISGLSTEHSFHHILSYRTELSSCLQLLGTNVENAVLILLCSCPLPRERVCRTVAQKWQRREPQKTPFLYCCVRYLATAALHRVTA
jgi:hypothetical protein